MAAELEEIAIDGDYWDREQLGEYFGELAFDIRSGDRLGTHLCRRGCEWRGSAARSTLPVVVRGNVSSITNTAGTTAAGRLLRSAARKRVGSDSRATTYADELAIAWAQLVRDDDGIAHGGRLEECCSIRRARRADLGS